jgi:5-methyltetrahydrofolate--homocysteine methyltransferase
MKTYVRGPRGKEVVIGGGLPTVLLGERINPFGKGPVKEGMATGNMEPIRKEAAAQVDSGADILIVSVSAFGIDEVRVLPLVMQAVMDVVDVPLCIESRNPEALEKALRLGCGKPIVSSVTGEGRVLEALLPLVKAHGAALVALASDASGIPRDAAGRMEVVKHILERTDASGVPREDILVDCVAEASAVNNKAVPVTLGAMEQVQAEWGLNLVLGASNVSFGLPGRTAVNAVFLALAIQAGLSAAIVNPSAMVPYAMAADLLVGRDPRARRFMTYYRKQKAREQGGQP